MPDNKFSLDDILDEYSTAGKKTSFLSKKVQADEVIASIRKDAGPDNVSIQSDAEKLNNIIKQNYPKKPDLNDASDYNNSVSSAKPVTVLQNESTNNKGMSQTFADHAEVRNEHLVDKESVLKDNYLSNPKIKPLEDDYCSAPRIRPMSNSTRAKELKSLNSKKSGRKALKTMPSYEKESIRSVHEELKAVKKTGQIKQPKPVYNEFDYAQQNNEQQLFDVKIEQENKTIVKKARKKKESADDLKEITSELYNLKGTIILRIIILSVMALFSIYITFANDYDLPIFTAFKAEFAPQSYAFTLLVLGGISIMSSIPVILNGLKMLFTFKADSDSLTSLSVLSCIIAGFAIISNTGLLSMGAVHMYIPIAVMALLFNAIGKLFIISRAFRNIEFLVQVKNKHAVVFVDDERKAETLTRGTTGDYPILTVMRKTQSMSDFLKYTFSTDLSDRFCKIFTPVIFGCSILISAFCAIRLNNTENQIIDKMSFTAAASIFSMCISACACFAITFVTNIPLYNASKKLNKSGVILGYQSIEDFYDTNSVLVDAASLFPKGMVNLSAIKPYSDVKIDDAIILASSLSIHAGSVLKDMFSGMIEGNSTMLFPVENFIYEDSLGICGWINNKRVLLGNRALMTSHSIEGIPSKTKEFEYTENGKDAVYLSVSGNLAAMFVVEVNASLEVKHWLQELQEDNICLVLKSIDPLISLSRISRLFGVSEEMIKIIPSKLHKLFESETTEVKTQSTSIICTDKFSSFAQMLIGTKSIKQTSTFGIILQAASAILGFAIAAVFIAMKAYDKISVSALLIYNLIWAALTIAILKFRKI